MLIPTDDAGAIFLAEYGRELRPSFLFPDLPGDLPRRLAGKYSLSQVCRELGVASPLTVLPESLAQAREFAQRAGYPVIAKLTDPWRAHGRLRSTQVIADGRELREVYDACARAGAGLMLQEFVPGGAGHDWFFHGYCDADSDVPARVHRGQGAVLPVRGGADQLRPVGAERCAQGRGHRAARPARLPRPARPRHPAGRQRDGRYHLLDFNPRLGAQFRVFRDAAGTDVALAAYLDLTGQPIPPADQVDGRSFVVENYDPISALTRWRAGELDWRSWLASVRGADEWAWFARDDLRPFGLMCVRMGWRALTRKLARSPAGPPPATRLPAPPAAISATGLAAAPAASRLIRHISEPVERTFASTGRNTIMTESTDVAIIGAGPYGLSLAAHLSAAGVTYRHFGVPMRLWRTAMPEACTSSRRASPRTCPTQPGSIPSRPSAGPPAGPTELRRARPAGHVRRATAAGSRHSWP